MKINNLGYLMKEGIRGIFLHGFASAAAICVTIACLLIVGGFTCLTYNLSIMVEDLNQTNQVMVYVDENYSDAEAKAVGTLINKIPNVLNAPWVSREKALEDFIADHGGDSSLAGVDANPFRHRFAVTLKDNSQIRETVAALEKVEGVVKVKAAYDLAEGFATLQNVLHISSIAVIGVLLVVSLLIISNTVKLAMYDRKEEIAIMKMVGATNGFIRLPYVVECFILGMLSAGLAFGALWLTYDWAMQELNSMETLKLLTLVPFKELLLPMIATFTVAGLVVSVMGSWISIRKFMNV